MWLLTRALITPLKLLSCSRFWKSKSLQRPQLSKHNPKCVRHTAAGGAPNTRVPWHVVNRQRVDKHPLTVQSILHVVFASKFNVNAKCHILFGNTVNVCVHGARRGCSSWFVLIQFVKTVKVDKVEFSEVRLVLREGVHTVSCFHSEHVCTFTG